MTTDGWVPEPKPVPEGLDDDFRPEPYDAALPHEHDHITSWASFGDILGPEGVAALAKAVR